MKRLFDKKRFWLISAILAVIEVLLLVAFYQWKYIFPSNEVSDLYRHYADVENIDATFIKDYKINDTVFVDVTLLEAKDSAGWAALKHDFAVPELNDECQAYINNREDLIFSHNLTPTDYPISIPKDTILFDELAVSYYSQSITIFHAKDDNEVLAILHHRYQESINHQ